jgi:hypothetical protein
MRHYTSHFTLGTYALATLIAFLGEPVLRLTSVPGFFGLSAHVFHASGATPSAVLLFKCAGL